MTEASTSKKGGKDSVVYASPEEPTTKTEPESSTEEPQYGLIRPDGSINWDCPCLGGMASGPCGVEFRSAFSCFHYSNADPKGSDCIEAFSVMQTCMQKYPEIYSAATEDESTEEPSSVETPPPAEPVVKNPPSDSPKKSL